MIGKRVLLNISPKPCRFPLFCLFFRRFFRNIFLISKNSKFVLPTNKYLLLSVLYKTRDGICANYTKFTSNFLHLQKSIVPPSQRKKLPSPCLFFHFQEINAKKEGALGNAYPHSGERRSGGFHLLRILRMRSHQKAVHDVLLCLLL